MPHETRAVLACALAAGVITLGAQDRLPQMPGVDNYTRMLPQLSASFTSGAVSNVQWAADGRSFSYVHSGKSYRFDLATMKAVEAGEAPPALPPAVGGTRRPAGRTAGLLRTGVRPGWARTGADGNAGGAGGGLSERDRRRADGRSTASSSPDGKLKAFYRDRNFWVANFDGTGEKQVTTDGSVEKRIKNGIGQLGLRRRARPDDGDLVVAGQHARSATTASTRARSRTSICR